MRTTTIRWSLISALASLSLAACSGAGGDPSPADVPEGTASAPLEAAPAGHGGMAQRDPAKFIQHFDKNGDGKLEVSELPERMQKFLCKADADKDGTLTVAELTAAKETFMKARFAKMDKSGDGALTADEVGDKRWARISVADADGNGSVTFSEMEAALAAGKLHFPGHHRHMGEHSKDAPAPVGS
jgi:Ca2+-binding EF-hand superfamily protein